MINPDNNNYINNNSNKKSNNKLLIRNQTLEQFFNPIIENRSDLTKKTKSPNEKRFHDLIQPTMRFKPRIDLERILDEVNKNNYNSVDRSIIDKQLAKLDMNNLIILNNSSEAEHLDESMEHYLKYVNSQNRIAIMKMIQDKTLDKIVKQYKKEEKDQKIINYTYESNKDGNNSRKKNYSYKIKKQKEDNKSKQDKKKPNKSHFIDKSCAKDILKDLHTKTYFNATNIIASNSKLANINETIKNLNNEVNVNNKLYENKINATIIENKSLVKKTKSFQELSTNNSFSSKTKLSAKANLNLGNTDGKKTKFSSKLKTKNIISPLKHRSDSTDPLLEKKSEEKFSNNNQLDSNKKNINKTENNFFRGSKINLPNFQSKNNIVENVILKFKNTFNLEKDEQNQDFEENSLMYNPNFNYLRKKQKIGDDLEPEKLNYLKKLAFAQNKKFNNKRFNNLARYNIERNSITKKQETEKEANLDDSDEYLIEINNELKNSFNNHSNKNIEEKFNPIFNISLNNEKHKSSLSKNNKENNYLFGSSNNIKGIYSPNSEGVIKVNELAKEVVDKCNFVMKKHKNNNTKLVSGNGKLMITSGLSVKDFLKKFNFK